MLVGQNSKLDGHFSKTWPFSKIVGHTSIRFVENRETCKSPAPKMELGSSFTWLYIEVPVGPTDGVGIRVEFGSCQCGSGIECL